MIVELRVNKEEVLNEVAMTTSYTGAKMEDVTAYDRIFTTDEDREQLERFWEEAQSEMCKELIRVISDERMNGADYIVKLNVSGSFDSALLDSMNKSMKSYFVQSITGKWYVFTNKGESEGFEGRGLERLQDVKRKAYFKGRPEIPDRYKRTISKSN